jgi:hypothetical protein
MNNLVLETIPVMGTNETTLLTAREIKVRRLAELAGWHMGGLVRHATGHQICFWRGGVAFITERRVARKKVTRWVLREVRRDLRKTK